MKNVVVVGAGAAGLCAARLVTRWDIFKCVIFEQAGDLGGIWKYSDYVDEIDAHGVLVNSPASMYKHLRTNLPKEVMAFPDFPFPMYNGLSYLHHTEILQYLKDYARHFDLLKCIKFNTKVEEIKPESDLWQVTTKEMKSGASEKMFVDAVIVCVGHYSYPRYPEIVGLQSYTGKIIHSHNYRTNEQFQGLAVVLLGAGSSGIDIALEVMDVAKEVWLSHDLQFHLLTEGAQEKKIHEVPGILNIRNRTVTFKNGSSCHSDALILCTGYNMNLNFLHPSCRPTVDDGRLTPLFKHMIHIYHPTLAILGVPLQVIPFPLYHQQLLFFLKTLDGSVNLPSVDEMLSNAESDFSRRLDLGMPARYAHKMTGELQWDYHDDLFRLGGIPNVPAIIRKMYDCVSAMRKKSPSTYRDYRLIIKSGAFEVKHINDR